MTETEREPCPHCAEPVALEARICPHCHGSALHDLALAAPVADGRSRYQVARALAAPSGEPFMDLQRRLGEDAPRPVRGRTRRQVRELGAVLEPFGLEWSAAPAGAPPAAARPLALPSRRALVVAAASVALVAAFALAVAALRRGGPEPAAVAVPSGAPPVADAGRAPDAAPELSAVDRAERALASTVALRCPDGLGAGFFVTPDLILTNAHVATCDAAMQVVLADGRQAAGVVLRRDTRLDLAVVRAVGLDVTPLPLADAGELRVGDRVTLVGSPVGLEFTVHEGIVSSLPRMVLGVAYIQLDAKVNPGNSGGPLIDERGRVVGVVSLKRTDAEGIGLALPINYAWDDAASLVPPPGGDRTRSQGFARMVEQVAAEEREVVAQLGDAPQQPLLVAAGRDEYARLVLVVARVSMHQPTAEDFDLIVRAQGKECRLRGGVAQWKPVEPKSAQQSAMDERVLAWLQSVGKAAGIYAGEVVLSLHPCRFTRYSSPYAGGVQVELEGADPRAARLQM